ncbi:MAG TPA: DsbA family protein [Chthonomonadaceae bacterium]|nr:DsbA family protein [Chthonomonadaceae bacterium]
MPRLIVAHDCICPWCWIAVRQAERLKEEFPTLELRWVGFELLPEGMVYTPAPRDPNADKKPPIPTRFELMLLAEGLTLPTRKGKLSNSRRALEGGEFAWEAGRQWAYIVRLYHAYWEEDRDISDLAVLRDVAEGAGLDGVAYLEALENRTYRDQIVEFDDPAYEAGVYNVPTWKFPEAWVAETPYSTVRAMAERFIRPLS